MCPEVSGQPRRSYVLGASSFNYCFNLNSDQAGNFLLPPFPGPGHKRTLSTLQRKYLHIEITPEIIKIIHLNNFSFDNLDTVFLFPWRPDHTHILKILQFSFLDCLSQ
ncbi:hypothetical protein ATANTOWER_003756 [Ataeniobius toweri]|uniref:Uncharacterized protein n=1 Tax=Ataeniobius toweri TaxID=208326 RepID=A0ABU7CEF0_9TELE|nr:hypothetical protein [Ataeniobius toweri]